MKTNYQVVYFDYVQNEIIETKQDVNEVLDIYSSLGKAKKILIKYLSNEKNQIQERISEIRLLCKEKI